MSEYDANKERLELALEAAGFDLWENNLITGEIPRKAKKIFSELGYGEAETNFYVNDMFAIIHPDDHQPLQNAIQDHLSGVTEQYRSELRVRARNGQWVWYANYGKIMDKDGLNQGKRFIGVTFNINDRKEKEEQLAIQEQELRTLIEHNPDTIARYDADCRRIYVNPALSALLDRGAASLLRTTPSDIPGGPESLLYEAKIKGVFSTGLRTQFEFRWRTKNGIEACSHICLTAERNLSGTITSVLAVGRDISELINARDEIARTNARLEQMNAQLESLASIDPLTQLPNRRVLQDRLHQVLASCSRSGQLGAIMFIDLDNFKTLNDTLGHDIGDILLQQVARRLVSCVREGDTVARLGGDEFVIMLEGLSRLSIEAAAMTEVVGNKILELLNQPYLLASHQCHSTPSIGVTFFGDYKQSVEEIMKQADIAMYQAKKSGRNVLRFFDQQMQDSINTRSQLEEMLRQAMTRKEFQLFYQIQVDHLDRPVGAEALIRWMHPTQGIVSPFEFIPLAEDTGLIIPLGKWVLETACHQLQRWQENPLACKLVLAINVSARQFRDAGFVAQVKQCIEQYSVLPGLLKLELTESLLLENIEETVAKMNALNAMGIQFSLDDFGTGYSSLQYLKKLPLDQLKIDQSFVKDITTDNSDKTIVRTIVAMANSLNLKVIAEGVETPEQRARLLNKGCLCYQGYLFSKPVPIDEFEAMLILRNQSVA
jgi:diguanylate cyclase (GGDEF)-like protein/PAS domain S-box-containing protein